MEFRASFEAVLRKAPQDEAIFFYAARKPFSS
jgi:hypothetical protein